jgi:hypothetical protein
MSDQEMRDRLTKLETTVGTSPEEGLRNDIAEIKANIGQLFDRLSASERRMAMMVGGGVVVVWVIEHFVK